MAVGRAVGKFGEGLMPITQKGAMKSFHWMPVDGRPALAVRCCLRQSRPLVRARPWPFLKGLTF